MSLTADPRTAHRAPPPPATPRAPARPPGNATATCALVRRGLRDNRRAPLTWGGGLGALGGLVAALWPSISDAVAGAVERYPEQLKEAFGITVLNTVEAYVDAEMLSFLVPLAVAVLAIRCAARPLVGAEERGHLDTLLSLPVSRHALAGASLAVAGIVSAAVLAVVWALTWIAGTLAGTGISAGTLAAGVAAVWPLAMAFAGLAVLASGLTRGSATVTAITAGTLVAMYVVDLVGRLAPAVEPFRVLSAFRYYGSAVQGGLDLSHAAVLLAAAAALGALGSIAFARRDLR